MNLKVAIFFQTRQVSAISGFIASILALFVFIISPMDIRKQKRLTQLQKQFAWLQEIENQLLQKDKRFFWYRLASFGAAWVGAILISLLIPGGYWVTVFIFFLFVF